MSLLIARPNKSERLRERLSVLVARGPSVNIEAGEVVSHPAHRRAERAAWDTYLGAAFALGLFDEPHDADLRARLTGLDDNAFRSAMAECMIGWVLAGKLRLTVTPRPEGRKGHPLEYLIRHPSGDIRVEVKEPYRPLPTGQPWFGDDSDLLASALTEANKQFDSGVRNLLVLAPRIRVPVYQNRGQLARAFYGQPVFEIPINTTTGGPAGNATLEFSPDGSFLNPRNPAGKRFKLDGTPPYTRVGAVLCVEEELQHNHPAWMDHRILVAHNPRAPHRIPEDPWKSIPQPREVDDEMMWSDGGKPF